MARLFEQIDSIAQWKFGSLVQAARDSFNLLKYRYRERVLSGWSERAWKELLAVSRCK